MGQLVRIFEDSQNQLYSTYQVAEKRIPYSNVKETNLVYDSTTKVLYYQFDGGRATNNRVGYMAPYISENGKACRFIDGKIVEIT